VVHQGVQWVHRLKLVLQIEITFCETCKTPVRCAWWLKSGQFLGFSE